MTIRCILSDVIIILRSGLINTEHLVSHIIELYYNHIIPFVHIESWFLYLILHVVKLEMSDGACLHFGPLDYMAIAFTVKFVYNPIVDLENHISPLIMKSNKVQV